VRDAQRVAHLVGARLFEALQHQQDVHIGGRAQLSFRGRPEQHDGHQIGFERGLRRLHESIHALLDLRRKLVALLAHEISPIPATDGKMIPAGARKISQRATNISDDQPTYDAAVAILIRNRCM
jgi:hypothetical protein